MYPWFMGWCVGTL